MVRDAKENVYRCAGEGGKGGDPVKSGRVRLSEVHGRVQGRETGNKQLKTL